MFANIQNKLQYAKRELQENASDPVWRTKRVNDRINGPIQRSLQGDRGLDVMDADWDTLIILDACRADLFEQTIETDGFDDYRRERSRGSSTAEWSAANFTGEYGDTVYLSGNPVASTSITGEFHEYIEFWQDAFDEDIGTISAPQLTERALEIHEEYPNKRIIVHYMQPHYPFVKDQKINFSYWDGEDGIQFGNDKRASDAWDAICLGLITADEVWEAYRRNLDYVVDYVNELVSSIDGRTVVHSDHGNLLGERSHPIPVKTYGHPPGLRVSELITVPWAVYDGDRRQIRDDGLSRGEKATADEMTAQLQALGYRE